jgi:hypothetical protein
MQLETSRQPEGMRRAQVSEAEAPVPAEELRSQPSPDGIPNGGICPPPPTHTQTHAMLSAAVSQGQGEPARRGELTLPSQACWSLGSCVCGSKRGRGRGDRRSHSACGDWASRTRAQHRRAAVPWPARPDGTPPRTAQMRRVGHGRGPTACPVRWQQSKPGGAAWPGVKGLRAHGMAVGCPVARGFPRVGVPPQGQASEDALRWHRKPRTETHR